MKEPEIRVVDCGRYGVALAWVRPGREPSIREVETIDKTGGIRTIKPHAALVEMVKRALRKA